MVSRLPNPYALPNMPAGPFKVEPPSFVIADKEDLKLGDFTFFAPDGVSALAAAAASQPPATPIDKRLYEQRLSSRESYFAYSGEGCVQVEGADEPIAGRMLACSCFRGGYLSATVRKDSGPKKLRFNRSTIEPFLKFGTVKSAYAARPWDPGNKTFPFGFEAQVEVIWKHLEPRKRGLQGLIVVCGTTGSGKSQIVRGLIDRLLSVKRHSDRRPHLLTIEDPIEAYYSSPKLIQEVPEGSRARDTYRATRLAEDDSWNEEADPVMACLSGKAPIPPWVTQMEAGIDYTPREIGVDTPSLTSALRDALRQTPSVVYIGEIRDLPSLREAIDFAGTGHLVVLTMHAGSLTEAFEKLLDAANAHTPSRRGEIAERISGVIHLWKAPVDPFDIKIPTMWRGRDDSRAALVADGLSSLVAGSPQNKNKDCLGRYAVSTRLLAARLHGLKSEDVQRLKRVAMEADLVGL
jgi:hypothetical protein